MQGSKPCALPLGDTPSIAGFLTVDLHRVNEVYFAFTATFCQHYFLIFFKKTEVFSRLDCLQFLSVQGWNRIIIISLLSRQIYHQNNDEV